MVKGLRSLDITEAARISCVCHIEFTVQFLLMSLKMKYLAKLKQILKVNYNENVDNIMKLKLTC